MVEFVKLSGPLVSKTLVATFDQATGGARFVAIWIRFVLPATPLKVKAKFFRAGFKLATVNLGGGRLLIITVMLVV